MLELIVLGSSGWLPQASRMTTSLCLRTPSTLFLFDAGTGLARLADPGLARLVKGDYEVVIVLSHLHLDHTVGLSYLPAVIPVRPVTIYAPDVERPGDGPGWLDRLISRPFFPHAFSEFPMPVRVEPIGPGTWRLGGHDVAVRRQVHPGGSLGYRLGDCFAFLTDYAPDADSASFAHGVQLLAHEAWSAHPQTAGPKPPPHHAAVEAAEVAKAAGVGELLLTHLNPLHSPAEAEEVLLAARGVFPRTCLSEDGMSRLLT